MVGISAGANRDGKGSIWPQSGQRGLLTKQKKELPPVFENSRPGLAGIQRELLLIREQHFRVRLAKKRVDLKDGPQSKKMDDCLP